jgi:pilus assembly protein Flp/PilA
MVVNDATSITWQEQMLLFLCGNQTMKGEQIMNWFTKMYIKWITTVKSEKGQAIVEYALILVLIAIVVIAMLKGIGQNANNAFSQINSALTQ